MPGLDFFNDLPLQSVNSSNSWTELLVLSLSNMLLLIAVLGKRMMDNVEEIMQNLLQAYPCTIVLLLLFIAFEDFRRSVINMLVTPALLIVRVSNTFRAVVTAKPADEPQDDATEAQSRPQDVRVRITEAHPAGLEAHTQPAQETGNFVIPPSESIYATTNAPVETLIQNSTLLPRPPNPTAELPAWFTAPLFPHELYVNGHVPLPRSDPIWRHTPLPNPPSLIPAPAALRTVQREDTNELPITNGLPINLEGQLLEQDREDSDDGDDAAGQSHYYLPPGLLDDE